MSRRYGRSSYRYDRGWYVCLAIYAMERKVPRLAVATSKDLKHWTKFGPAFEKAYNGKFKDEATKSASLVTTLKGDKQVIAKVNGKYFMYWGRRMYMRLPPII